ncbi:MAG: hypothetical protein HXY34_01395 [Candidatus Thorarchaeota archaeon]|nr:hypothetical protein [Candidatus Thorarchaeota archaeon]
MKGYVPTPLENDFAKGVADLERILSQCGPEVLKDRPQLMALGITVLCRANAAAHAYRSRMWKYSTEYGSEVSVVAESSRRLLQLIRTVIESMLPEEKQLVYSFLPDETKECSFISYYWTDWNKHSEEMLVVRSLLGME